MPNLAFSSAALLRDFGAKSALARYLLPVLASSISDDGDVFSDWRSRYLASIPDRKKNIPDETLRQIFATQTYYVLILKRLAAHRLFPNQRIHWTDLECGHLFAEAGITNFTLLHDYDWYLRFFRGLEHTLEKIETAILRYTFDAPPPDALKTLYQELFKRQWRHTAGEYFTPDWLANFTLNQLGYVGEGRLLDPACGTGTFLMLALHRLLQKMSPSAALQHIQGIDINPLAVLSAQVNLVLAIGRLPEPVFLPIHRADAILNPPHIGGGFDFIAGNPPWVNLETLPEIYRQALNIYWEQYGLFVHTGMATILGNGKKDLSMLLTYATADRHLREGGKLGFIVAPSLFKSGGAGAGFRQFRTANMALKVLSVDDVSALNPFPEIGSGSAVLLLQKGTVTAYPVTYRVWRLRKKENDPTSNPAPYHREGNAPPPLYAVERGQGGENAVEQRVDPVDRGSGGEDTMEQGAIGEDKIFEQNIAVPINPDDLTSAWLTGTPPVLAALRKIMGSSDYVAHAGVYTGGANGVYWLEILETLPNGCLRVRNITEGAKRAVPQVERIIEAGLVYPLLRGQDVNRWHAVPTAAILMVQHPQQRRGYDARWLQTHYPLTLAYLQQFETLLRGRATFKRYFPGDVPYYTMFDIAQYSFAPFKTVWQGMGSTTMQAAVVAQQPIVVNHPEKPIMPNQAMHPFIALANENEAHYLAACLNSAPFTLAVRSHTQPGGKSFAQPGILKVLRLPRYEPQNPIHQQLVFFSRCAHAGDSRNNAINALAAQLWHLSEAELAAVMEALDNR